MKIRIAPRHVRSGTNRRPATARRGSARILVMLVLTGLLAVLLAAGLRSFFVDRTEVVETAQQAPAPDPLAHGEALYRTQCQRCHGAEGHGDGPDAVNQPNPPRDFSKLPWRFSPTAESIKRVVREGIPGTVMLPWGQFMPKSDLDALVAYVLTLAPPAPPPENSPDPSQPPVLPSSVDRSDGQLSPSP